MPDAVFVQSLQKRNVYKDYYLKKDMKKSALFLIIFLSLLFVGSGIYLALKGVPQMAITSTSQLPSNVKLAIPHNGAYSCQSVGTGNPTYELSADGFYISKKSIGVYTDQVTNINVYIPSSTFFKGLIDGKLRAKYGYCDAYEKNCVIEYKYLNSFGTATLPLKTTALNPQTESFFVVIQKNPLLSSWQNVEKEGATISFAYTKYGLKYVSTTGNPAGSLFAGCESSCDLTCPEQKSRSDTGLIYTSKDSLLPTESVPVLEYWESIDIDLNNEFGGTIYDGSKFCFGGAIYSKASVTLDNGITYIYPNTATRKNVECCVGAVISTSSEDKICQSDNTWKTITKETRISCVSDFNCPGQGKYTCQNLIRSGWNCESGFCEQGSNKTVKCCSQADCPTDQTCQNYKCVGGATEEPLNLTEGGTETQLTCGFFKDLKSTESCKGNPLCWIGIVDPKPVQKCVLSTWVYLTVLAIILGLVLLSLVLKFRRKR